jgi:hypothetical protein
MNNVIYLIGAGASIGAVPIVSGLRESITKEAEDLLQLKESFKNLMISQYNFTTFEVIDYAVQSMMNLVIESEEFHSIDNYANKLFQAGQFEELNSLKLALTLYFGLIQLKDNKVDTRYIQFLSNILKNEVLNPSIKILSWNYDFQFEKALSRILPLGKYADCSKYFEIDHGLSNGFDYNKFFISKLNGTAGIRDLDNNINQLFDTIKKFNPSDKIKFITNYYIASQNGNLKPSLRFAWENNTDILINEKLRAQLRKASNVIIIGYSLPDYNFNIDSEIISLCQSARFSIQCKDDNQAIADRLRTEFGIKSIQIIDQVNNFYIPREVHNLIANSK